MVFSRIEKYIKAIDPIAEGERNASLYRVGLSLRAKFGFVGNELELALSEVNHAKCSLPLPDADVRRIAGQVDKSNRVPLGDGNDTYTASPLRTVQKEPVKRYSVSIAESPVPVAELRAKEVSLYSSVYKTTSTGIAPIGGILDMIRTGGNSKERILAIRDIPDKKGSLP